LTVKFAAAALFSMAAAGAALAGTPEVRRLAVAEYRDKMKAGWLGQIAGVSWGAPTEFKYRDKIMPENVMPKWKPGMINNAFGQDDLYVEMTFLRTLEQLDDLVYESIAGNGDALERLREYWPKVREELGDDLLIESRAQYLRYALSIWEECLDGKGIRQPERAVQSLDVLCLLFDEIP
jgi:hypothetical protein